MKQKTALVSAIWIVHAKIVHRIQEDEAENSFSVGSLLLQQGAVKLTVLHVGVCGERW